MKYSVKRIDTKPLQKDFIRLPRKIYRDDPNWVPPPKSFEKQMISPKHNPFLKYGRISLFGVYDKQDNICGRIAAVANPAHNRINSPTDGFFGLFECIKDLQVARLLIEAAEDEVRRWGFQTLIGPVNFTSNDRPGFLLNGYDSPAVIMTAYGPQYYPQYMEELGYRKREDFYAYLWKKGHRFPERFETMARRAEGNSALTVRKFRPGRFREEVKILQNLHNLAFEGLRDFVPVNKDEARVLAERFKLFADPDVILFGEYRGEEVGFCLTVPDINQVYLKEKGKAGSLLSPGSRLPAGKLKSLRLMDIGILPGYRNRGIVLLLIHRLVEEALAKGYETCELSLIMESNQAIKHLIESLGFQQVKKYRLYARQMKI